VYRTFIPSFCAAVLLLAPSIAFAEVPPSGAAPLLDRSLASKEEPVGSAQPPPVWKLKKVDFDAADPVAVVDPAERSGTTVDLHERLRLLEQRAAAQQKQIDEIEERSRYQLGQLGIGISFPMVGSDNSDASKARLHGKLRFLQAYYYPTSGSGFGVELPLRLGPVTLRPVGLGAMIYERPSRPLTSKWLAREFDLVIPVGVDVRVWEGLTITGQVSWFLPNPIAVSNAAAKAGEAKANDIFTEYASHDDRQKVKDACQDLYVEIHVDDIVIDQNSGDATVSDGEVTFTPECRQAVEDALTNIEQIGLERFREIPDDARGIVKRAYSDAFSEPRIEIMLSWSW
jgi:hypothetical protein